MARSGYGPAWPGSSTIRSMFLSSRRRDGLAVDEIERLRRAELALAGAASIESAAHELGKHAMALLDAPAAVVIIEGVADTVRMEAGDTTGHSIYDAGS